MYTRNVRSQKRSKKLIKKMILWVTCIRQREKKNSELLAKETNFTSLHVDEEDCCLCLRYCHSLASASVARGKQKGKEILDMESITVGNRQMIGRDWTP